MLQSLEPRRLFAVAATAEPFRVYMIGNSMTDQAGYAGLAALAASRGHAHVWGRQTIFGSAVSDVWEQPDAGITQPPFGTYPGALADSPWDAVTLNPTDRNLVQPDGFGDVANTLNFLNLARQHSPGVQVYLLERTPRRPKNPDGTYASIDYQTQWLRPYSETDASTEFTRDYFYQLAGEVRRTQPAGGRPVQIIPVGDVFQELDVRMKQGKMPGLANVNQLYVDGSHYTNLGSYVAGLTFYASLYDESPIGLGVPQANYGGSAKVSAAQAAALQQAVWDVVRATPYTDLGSAAGANHAPAAAAAVTTPASGAAPLTVSFDGAGSADPDGDELTYAWDFGDGATAVTASATHVYAGPGTYTARLTVSDGRGKADVSRSLLVISGNAVPVPAITAPLPGRTYAAGDVIAFAGGATDAEDGTLNAAGLRWDVTLYRGGVATPVLADLSGTDHGAFVAVGEVNAVEQRYRVSLTATDFAGAAATTFYDVRPRLTYLTVASNVPGATLGAGGANVTAGTATRAVAGTSVSLAAPPTQAVNGRLYVFASWSDGGAASHAVDAAETDATYTATYDPVPAAPPGDNLALNRPTTASSEESATFSAAKATDAAATTRWSSKFIDGQWLRVDLGAECAITGAALKWEAAFARGYKLQASANGTTWADLFGTTTGDGGADSITGLRGTGRYVRLLGVTRATKYGLSLFEFAVFGNALVTPPPAPPPPAPLPPPTNLALNRPTTASTSESAAYAAAKATDAGATTRWSSAFADDQWIRVDLGAARAITGVTLTWEAAFAKSYRLQTSTDGSGWTDRYATTTGDGGTDAVTSLIATGRYVRMLGVQRGTKYGYSLFDFAVYGT